MTSAALAVVKVEPLQGDIVGKYTTVKPQNLPRCIVHLDTQPWTGPIYDNVPDAMEAALSKYGMAVLRDSSAMFRIDDDEEEARVFDAVWFQNLPTSPDTTTIPYTEWLPHDTHHDFARHLHENVFLRAKNRFFSDDKESYAGIVSIGGVRRRGSRDASPNLQFPHQDECKLSVLMAEHAAVSGPNSDFLDGLDTIKETVREGLEHSFLDEDKAPKDYVITCRQINFWCPHEDNGDKYLVVMPLEVSQALVDAGLVTASQLPRFSTDSSHASLDAVNCNFQLSNRAIQFIQKHFPDQVYAVNRPIIFLSHWTRYDKATLSAIGSTENARRAIFHFGASLRNLGHASTEMRLAVLTTS